MTNITAASKYIPRSPRISINWNPPFQKSFYKIFMKFKFRGTYLGKFGSERGDFNWCKFWPYILGRYVFWCFDGICQEDVTFIQIGSGHTLNFSKLQSVFKKKKGNWAKMRAMWKIVFWWSWTSKVIYEYFGAKLFRIYCPFWCSFSNFETHLFKKMLSEKTHL